jgi:hypothetical protein
LTHYLPVGNFHLQRRNVQAEGKGHAGTACALGWMRGGIGMIKAGK